MSFLGVWMWPDSLAAQGAEGAADRCARIGVTDIYFLTKGLSGTASYRSGLAPCAADRDPLGELLACAHRRGIRVHAWFTSASDEHYKQLHPQSGRCHFTRGRDKGLISLADEGYLAYMREVVREVCRGYDIDGVHLDYIRYNHLLYGWDEKDLARYAAAGADGAELRRLMERAFPQGAESREETLFDALRRGNESLRALARARRQDVTRFARALCETAKSEKQGAALSAALMPEGAYDDTAFADLHYGQSYQDAAELYDYVIPMAYSRAYEKDSQWVRTVARGTLKKGCRAVMGLHAYEGGTGDTLRSDMAALAGLPVLGVCLFREGAFVPALSDGRRLVLYNPLPQPLTALGTGEKNIPLETPVLPGEEKSLPLPCRPEELRVFAGDKEVCVFPAEAGSVS